MLDQILDEYGLIVCGWSAEWDVALSAALERRRSRRFTTYWTFLRNPRGRAALLINHLRAEEIKIEGANPFFLKLAEHVASQEDLERPHPLSAPLAQATVKRYLVDDRQRIRLHDLVMNEANRIYGEVTSEDAPALTSPIAPDELANRLVRYEVMSETMAAIMATGGYWGEVAHHGLWVRCLRRIATMPRPIGAYVEPWLNLRLYPALLAIYAGGIAAIAANRYDSLAAILVEPQIPRRVEEIADPFILAVNSYRVIDIDTSRRLPGKENNIVPFNDYLYFNSPLKRFLLEYLPEDHQFTSVFDRFEYLLGLVVWDLNEKRRGHGRSWAPVGCFIWRDHARYEPSRMRVVQEIGAEIEAAGSDWPLLKAGLFDRSPERLVTVKAGFDALIGRI